jgi:RNA polymerase sigma-70 factor (ECF subfamily)
MEIKKFEHQLVEVEEKLENFAYSLTFNKEDAKDLVQDTYLKAILHQNAFEEGSNLNAWLFTIMKNTFINSYRRTKKEKTIISKEQETPWINNLAGDKSYDADQEIKYSQMLFLINKLPEEQKNPFEMINQGYKYHEIAELYHIPIGTVKSRIFLARKKLGSQLEQ